jgi:hypothetical protein
MCVKTVIVCVLLAGLAVFLAQTEAAAAQTEAAAAQTEAAAAQTEAAELRVTENEALVDFPNSVTFRLRLSPDSPLQSATLSYSVDKFSCLEAATAVPVTIDPANATQLEWTWVMIRSGNPPPGASLRWEWHLTGTSGHTLVTPLRQLTFSDDRFAWRTVAAQGIDLHWYAGDNVGPMLLEAAVEGLFLLQDEMGIELQSDVQIFIYGNSRDMREAVLYIQDWAGGVAFTEYNIILMGVTPVSAPGWGRRTVRHELAHLVLGQFGRSCVGGSRPNWLEEGLAVYAEGEPEQSVLDDLAVAIRENRLEPVRSLNGPFPAHGREAGIAYSQSYSLVAFLLEQYGQEKVQDLILTLAAGEGYDGALEQVYGFNSDGLELLWREAIGAQPRTIPATPTAIAAAAVPTYAPLGAPRAVPTPPEAAATAVPAAPEPEARRPALCGFGLLPVFLLVFVPWWHSYRGVLRGGRHKAGPQE